MKDKKIKVIISTGQGRLHLIQSAIALKGIGIKVSVITGWIPSNLFSDKLVNKMGKFIGRKHNLAAGLKKRTPPELDSSELFSCTSSEFIQQLLFRMTILGIYSRSWAAVIGWKLFGNQSKKFLQNADVFHVRSGAGQGGAIKFARKNGMKILVDHSIAHPSEMERQLLKANQNSLVKHNKFKALTPNSEFWKLVLDDCMNADCLLVNSEYVKWSFVKEGYPATKIKIAQLGINPEFNSVKSSYQKGRELKLIFTGGFGNRKGALIIIEALSLLKKQQILFTFDVVGSIMSDAPIPEWVKNSNNITFHGHLSQDKMLPLLLASDIYIFPSYVEGAAQSVKEAMGVGLPVIATRQSGAPIVDGENGILIDDHDAMALFSAIKKLAENHTFLEMLGRNAAKSIRQGHTWEKYANQVKSIYRELISADTLQ